MEICQSQVDANICAKKPMSGVQATGAVTPIAFDSGNQNTEKP